MINPSQPTQPVVGHPARPVDRVAMSEGGSTFGFLAVAVFALLMAGVWKKFEGRRA